jgi:hypothetical protein
MRPNKEKTLIEATGFLGREPVALLVDLASMGRPHRSAPIYWVAIHWAIRGQCSFSVRAPMNKPICPPGTVC